MYFISLLLVFILMALMPGGTSLHYLIDLPTLLIIILFPSILLWASGQHIPFLRGIKIMTAKSNIYTLKELEQSKLAIQQCIFLVILSACFAYITAYIIILTTLIEGYEFQSQNAVAMISLLYGLIAIMILTPIRFKISSLIVEEDNQ